MVKSGGIAGLIVGLTLSGVFYADEFLSYQPVDATITVANIKCYMLNLEDSRRVHQLNDLERYSRGLNSCETWETNATHRQRYRRFYRVHYEFEYTSPVDESRQYGIYKKDKLRDIRVYKVGDDVSIRAHKRVASKFVFW